MRPSEALLLVDMVPIANGFDFIVTARGPFLFPFDQQPMATKNIQSLCNSLKIYCGVKLQRVSFQIDEVVT